MDQVMLDTLREQLSLGNKGQRGWKVVAYTTVVNNVLHICRMKITNTNARNRLKTWKKIVRGVQKLLGLSGFGWNDGKKIVTADESVWTDALKGRKHLKNLKGKRIENYAELLELVGNDKTNGLRETTITMADEDTHANDDTEDNVNMEDADDNVGDEDTMPSTPDSFSSNPIFTQPNDKLKGRQSVIAGEKNQ